MFRKWFPLVALLVFVSHHAQAASITESLNVGPVSGSVFVEQSFLFTVLGTVDLGGSLRFGQLDFTAGIEGGEAGQFLRNPSTPQWYTVVKASLTMPYPLVGQILVG
jgi:hypothetical protein